MRYIELSKGKKAKVDDEDFKDLNQYKWSLNGMGRALRYENGKCVYMHRQIMKPKGKLWVDHVNGDPLDNRRKNLRVGTQLDNARNKRMYKNNSTGYKGVYLTKNTGRFRAAICIKGKMKSIGTYPTALEAYLAYYHVACKEYGEFFKQGVNA